MAEFMDHQERVKAKIAQGGSRRLPDDVLGVREEMRQRIMRLNAKGPLLGSELESVSGDALLSVQPAEHHSDAHADSHGGGLDVREHRGNTGSVV